MMSLHLLWAAFFNALTRGSVWRWEGKMCPTKSEKSQNIIYLYLSVGSTVLTGFLTLMAATISHTVAVIEFY